MNQRRKQIATGILIALVTGLAPTVDAWAADTGEVQDLQREVRQARADVQAMAGAMTELAELERRSAGVTRALEEPSPPAQPASRPPAPSSEAVTGAGQTTPPPAPSVTRDAQDRGASRNRKHRRTIKSRSKATRLKAGAKAR